MRKCRTCVNYGHVSRRESGCLFSCDTDRRSRDGRACRAYASRLMAKIRGERR